MTDSIKRMRYRDVRCETSGKSIVAHFCYIKSYGKFSSYFSMGFNLTRKIKNGLLTTEIERKTQSERYENVLSMKNIEFCQIVQGKEYLNLAVIKYAIQHLRQFGNIEDFCRESSAVIKMLNVTWDGFATLQTLPKGEYLFHYCWFDNKDEKIFKVKLHGNVF